MVRLWTMLALVGVVASSPLVAQPMMDLPIWSNGILGQSALRNTYDNYNKANNIGPDKNKPSRTCSADALPAADRKRMEMEYMRRAKADGKASADAWVQEQGRRFRMKLVAEGVCPAPEGQTGQVASAAAPPAGKEPLPKKKPLLDKTGKPCTRTRLENRVTPGFGGEAMSMGLVTVCAN